MQDESSISRILLNKKENSKCDRNCEPFVITIKFISYAKCKRDSLYIKYQLLHQYPNLMCVCEIL